MLKLATREEWIPKQNRESMRCKECNKDKHPSEFPKKGVTKSGLTAYHSRCKPCYLVYRERPSKGREPSVPQQKLAIIENAKKACRNCGYNRCLQALDFHHIDEKSKLFGISHYNRKGITPEILQAEIDKCVVLCSNCHREFHAGLEVTF